MLCGTSSSNASWRPTSCTQRRRGRSGGSSGMDDGEVGLTLVAADEIRVLKREHLGLDEQTDALAFPIDGRDELPLGMPRQLGDVVLCPQVVGQQWRGPLVHAVLHLVGYDHGPEMDARGRAHAT